MRIIFFLKQNAELYVYRAVSIIQHDFKSQIFLLNAIIISQNIKLQGE